MNELLFSLNVIIPLFLCCLTGYVMRRLEYIGESFAQDCSGVVFYIAIPCNIFISIVEHDFRAGFDGGLVAFVMVACTAIAFLSTVICRKVISNTRTAATVAHNIFRGNFTLLGIPLATSLLGKEGAVVMLLLVPFGILCSNIYSVLSLSVINPLEEVAAVSTIRKAVQKVITNPMTIASVLGIAISFSQLHLPTLIISPIDSFSQMSSGLALFMLGAQLKGVNLLKDWQYTAATVILRLVIIPLMVLLPAVLMGFRGNPLAVLLIFFASPTAVTCYIMADNMGGDQELSVSAVLATSCLSTITLTLGIFLLKSMRLI